jgi:hypothetical protein
MTDAQQPLVAIVFVLLLALALALAYARDVNDEIDYTIEEVRESR